jgi:CPA1 family monovalent cation:H+ antiporter
MSLITGEPRQADVKSQTYCRLLVLRKADFDRFMRANPEVLSQINAVAERRLSENRPEVAAAS